MADQDDCEATDMADNFGVPEVPIWNKPGEKDSAKASVFKLVGNEAFYNGDFKLALVAYNESLCYAPVGSEDIPLCYGNRSAVYCEMGKYALALKNIELARKNGYPADKIARLDTREEKCKKLMEKFGPDKNSISRSFFKLSHPPNENIPFIAGCLEMRKNEKYGRYIITNKDLKTGDIIAIEPPAIVWPDLEAKISKHCCLFCTKSDSLIPCSHCSTVMFCSEECKEKATLYHLIDLPPDETYEGMFTRSLKMPFEAYRIAGGVDEAIELLKNSEGKTIFDFDFSDPKDPDYEENMLIALNGLHKIPHEFRGVKTNLFLNIPPINEKPRTAQDCERISAFILNQFEIACTNVTGFNRNRQGIALFRNLLNHSCAPNIQCCHFDDKLISYACRPIKAGEQLFVCYIEHAKSDSREEHRKKLKRNFLFTCKCEACVNDWPLQLPRKDRNLLEPEDTNLEPAAAIERFKKNCKYIDENAVKMPCYEVEKLMDESHSLACEIADYNITF